MIIVKILILSIFFLINIKTRKLKGLIKINCLYKASEEHKLHFQILYHIIYYCCEYEVYIITTICWVSIVRIKYTLLTPLTS